MGRYQPHPAGDVMDNGYWGLQGQAYPAGFAAHSSGVSGLPGAD